MKEWEGKRAKRTGHGAGGSSQGEDAQDLGEIHYVIYYNMKLGRELELAVLLEE